MDGKFDYRTKDWFILLLAFSGALKLFLSVVFGIELAQEQFDATSNFVAIIVVIVGIWRNKYLTKKEKKQVEVLKDNGLK